MNYLRIFTWEDYSHEVAISRTGTPYQAFHVFGRSAEAECTGTPILGNAVGPTHPSPTSP